MDTKKPTTITAKQFVDDGYADKVAKGECLVIEEYITDLHKSDDAPCRFYDYKQMYFGDTNLTTVEYPEDREFCVFWLTPQQPAAVPPVASGQEDVEGDFQIVRDGIDMNKSIAPPVNALNRIEQELATLRQQLQAANPRARSLEEALIQAEMSFQEVADYAESEYPLDATVSIIARTGEKMVREALAAREPAANEVDAVISAYKSEPLVCHCETFEGDAWECERCGGGRF